MALKVTKTKMWSVTIDNRGRRSSGKDERPSLKKSLNERRVENRRNVAITQKA